MNDYETLLKVIRERRSIRSFSDRAVTREQIERLIEAARWAPSNHNRQPWRFLVLQDGQQIQALARAVAHGLAPRLKRLPAVAAGFAAEFEHYANFFATAPVLLIVWLWRQRAPDLVALRWGLITFLLGEASCAENYLACEGRSELWEFLHNYGMSVGFAFTAYALLEGLDRRVIKYSPAKERCAALSLCRACIKYADVPCGLRHSLTPADQFGPEEAATSTGT